MPITRRRKTKKIFFKNGGCGLEIRTPYVLWLVKRRLYRERTRIPFYLRCS
nr:MAG TPA: hypothetical protein [Caudoviricetes sp.]